MTFIVSLHGLYFPFTDRPLKFSLEVYGTLYDGHRLLVFYEKNDAGTCSK